MREMMLDVTTLDQTTVKTTVAPHTEELKVYRRRWLMLALFVSFCICNTVQWLQYAIMADVVIKYYGVGSSAVSWTTLVWMVIYVILIFPATWLLNNKGLRLAIIMGQLFNCVGAWIKVGSVSPDLFWVTLLGQSVVGLAQLYAMSSPAIVAATWFGSKQVSTATAIGVFGLMVGNALGNLLPPLLVQDGTIDEIGADLSFMFYSVAIFTTIVLVLIIIFFQNEPPTPPSVAQANRAGSKPERPRQFASAIWRMFRNPNFVLLFVAFGMSVGLFSAILTFLNRMILSHYPDGQVLAGNIGVTAFVCGLVGAIVCGALLDLSRKYKEMCLALYSTTALSCMVFTLLLICEVDPTFLYIISVFLGFLMIGYMPAGYEFGAELTYPDSEATSACVLALSTQAFGFVFTLSYGAIFEAHGDAANWFACGGLALGALFTAFIKPDLKRQRAEKDTVGDVEIKMT